MFSLSLLAALSGVAAAQQVVIKIDPDLADQAGVDPTQVEQKLSQTLDGQLHLDDFSGFMTEMANAAVLSSKGMGVDYATNPQRFVAGASVGSAVSGAGFGFGRGTETVPEGGFAFQISAMAGLNLGIGADEESAARRFLIYANGMALSTGLAPFKGSFVNFGAHAQVQLMRPGGRKGLFEFGGLALTSGYEYSSYALNLTQPLPVDADVVIWDATGTFDVSATASSVPVELSTNLRFSVLTAYLGAGFDTNLGSDATAAVALKGDVTAQADDQSLRLGSAKVSASLNGAGDMFFPRAFVGVQVNILPVKLYGHLNAATDLELSRLSFGGNCGLRFAI